MGMAPCFRQYGPEEWQAAASRLVKAINVVVFVALGAVTLWMLTKDGGDCLTDPNACDFDSDNDGIADSSAETRTWGHGLFHLDTAPTVLLDAQGPDDGPQRNPPYDQDFALCPVEFILMVDVSTVLSMGATLRQQYRDAVLATGSILGLDGLRTVPELDAVAKVIAFAGDNFAVESSVELGSEQAFNDTVNELFDRTMFNPSFNSTGSNLHEAMIATLDHVAASKAATLERRVVPIMFVLDSIGDLDSCKKYGFDVEKLFGRNVDTKLCATLALSNMLGLRDRSNATEWIDKGDVCDLTSGECNTPAYCNVTIDSSFEAILYLPIYQDLASEFADYKYYFDPDLAQDDVCVFYETIYDTTARPWLSRPSSSSSKLRFLDIAGGEPEKKIFDFLKSSVFEPNPDTNFRGCTRVPTSSPSKGPSVSPTRTPSKTPTGSPSRGPSRSPTKAPSQAPSTAGPTASPTRSPTKAPSRSPSKAPSQSPTTGTPTLSPTTASPSTSPTANPTGTPTQAPTLCPGLPGGEPVAYMHGLSGIIVAYGASLVLSGAVVLFASGCCREPDSVQLAVWTCLSLLGAAVIAFAVFVFNEHSETKRISVCEGRSERRMLEGAEYRICSHQNNPWVAFTLVLFAAVVMHSTQVLLKAKQVSIAVLTVVVCVLTCAGLGALFIIHYPSDPSVGCLSDRANAAFGGVGLFGFFLMAGILLRGAMSSQLSLLRVFPRVNRTYGVLKRQAIVAPDTVLRAAAVPKDKGKQGKNEKGQGRDVSERKAPRTAKDLLASPQGEDVLDVPRENLPNEVHEFIANPLDELPARKWLWYLIRLTCEFVIDLFALSIVSLLYLIAVPALVLALLIFAGLYFLRVFNFGPVKRFTAIQWIMLVGVVSAMVVPTRFVQADAQATTAIVVGTVVALVFLGISVVWRDKLARWPATPGGEEITKICIGLLLAFAFAALPSACWLAALADAAERPFLLFSFLQAVLQLAQLPEVANYLHNVFNQPALVEQLLPAWVDTVSQVGRIAQDATTQRPRQRRRELYDALLQSKKRWTRWKARFNATADEIRFNHLVRVGGGAVGVALRVLGLVVMVVTLQSAFEVTNGETARELLVLGVVLATLASVCSIFSRYAFAKGEREAIVHEALTTGLDKALSCSWASHTSSQAQSSQGETGADLAKAQSSQGERGADLAKAQTLQDERKPDLAEVKRVQIYPQFRFIREVQVDGESVTTEAYGALVVCDECSSSYKFYRADDQVFAKQLWTNLRANRWSNRIDARQPDSNSSQVCKNLKLGSSKMPVIEVPQQDTGAREGTSMWCAVSIGPSPTSRCCFRPRRRDTAVVADNADRQAEEA